MNLRFVLSIMIFKIFVLALNAQNVGFDYEVNLLTNFDQHGIQLQVTKPLTKSGEQWYQSSIGLSEVLIHINEGSLNSEGNTRINQFGVVFRQEVGFLKQQQLRFSLSPYFTWSHLRLKGRYTNDLYDIDRSIYTVRNYLGLGTFIKLGYEISPKITVQLVGQFDLSRAIDQYRVFTIEKPDPIFGLGIKYTVY